MVMYGETGRTGKKKCYEHRNALFDIRKSSNLREHCDLVHQGRIVDFGYSVVRMFPGDPLSCQIEEAILVDNHCGLSMNDQHEFVRLASVRLRAERS